MLSPQVTQEWNQEDARDSGAEGLAPGARKMCFSVFPSPISKMRLEEGESSEMSVDGLNVSALLFCLLA